MRTKILANQHKLFYLFTVTLNWNIRDFHSCFAIAQYICNYIYYKHVSLLSLKCILMHFKFKKFIQIYWWKRFVQGMCCVGKSNNEVVQSLKSWESQSESFSESFLQSFSSSIGSWPQIYTIISDFNSLKTPFQTSNIPPTYFRISCLCSFVPIWWTGPFSAQPNISSGPRQHQFSLLFGKMEAKHYSFYFMESHLGRSGFEF